MQRKLTILIITFLLFANAAKAQVAEYYFCVQSEKYETFKAHVVFRGLDFGRNSAKQMVRNDLEAVLEGQFEIIPFTETCPCEGECPQVEVSSKNWHKGHPDKEADLENAWGSAVEITDALISEGKALWDNPGEFLMTRILGQGDS